MKALADLQLRFSHSLLTGRNDIVPFLTPHDSDRLDSPLNIYQNAYQLRLVDSLKTDYPILLKVLGEDDFFEMALNYIDEYPSESYSMRHFGRYLARFLAQFTPYNERRYLAEMAQFEWLLVEVFDQSDTDIATVDDMTQFKPEQWSEITVELNPWLHLMTFNWNLIDLYQVVTANKPMPKMTKLPTPVQCIIWRKQLSPHFRPIDDREWLLLNTLKNSNFSALCQAIAELDGTDDNAALNAATYFKSWLTAELISTVYIAD